METSLKDSYKHGNLLNIYTYPHRILSKKADAVVDFNDELITLCRDMLHTMYHAPGIGLAAPQVGKSLRLFVIDVDYKRELVVNADGEEETILSNFNPRVFINPEITSFDDEIICYEEGCLSLPGVYEEVTRPRKVTIEYQDLLGNRQTQVVEDVAAVCTQHENDHLNGTVFIDHLSLLKKNFIRKKILKQKR